MADPTTKEAESKAEEKYKFCDKITKKMEKKVLLL